MAHAKYDWDLISAEYIQGQLTIDPETGLKSQAYPSLEDLVDKYGCSIVTIKDKAYREKWFKQRQLFKEKLRELNREHQASTYVNESTRIDALTLDKVTKLHKIIDYYIDDNFGTILEDTVHIDEVPRVNISDLKSLMGMIKDAHTLVRNVVGEPASGETNLVQELKNIRTSTVVSDTPARKRRLKQLETKLKTLDAQISSLEQGTVPTTTQDQQHDTRSTD